jgi:hypothetical protein
VNDYSRIIHIRIKEVSKLMLKEKIN